MAFDIRQLDRFAGEEYDSKAEGALEKYQDALIDRFYDSPEGQAHQQVAPDMGFWAAQLIYYGWQYVGVTLPDMTVGNVDEIVTELFPRKISTSSPDNADDAILELLAFWEYLKREYRLPQANAILAFLKKIQPQFKAMMNNPSHWGMAKSFFMAGKKAGFDMTDKEQADQFTTLYNASVIGAHKGLPDVPPPLSLPPPLPLPLEQGRHREDDAAKKRRKMAEKSRKRNRNKKR